MPLSTTTSEEKNNLKTDPKDVEYAEDNDIELDIVIQLDITDISDITSRSEEAYSEETSLECMILEYQKTGDKDLLGEIIKKSYHSINRLAERFSFAQSRSVSDFIQEGIIGVIEAAKRYDACRGAKFITYANIWIKKMMLEYMNREGASIRIPQNIRSDISLAKRLQQDMTEKLGRVPTLRETAEAFIAASAEKSGITPDYSDENIDSTEAYLDSLKRFSQSVLSLNRTTGDEDGSDELIDLIPDSANNSPEKHLEKKILNEEINRIIDKCLTENEARVLRFRFGIRSLEYKSDIPMTRAEIAEKMNISKDRVRQLEKTAKKK